MLSPNSEANACGSLLLFPSQATGLEQFPTVKCDLLDLIVACILVLIREGTHLTPERHFVAFPPRQNNDISKNTGLRTLDLYILLLQVANRFMMYLLSPAYPGLSRS